MIRVVVLGAGTLGQRHARLLGDLGADVVLVPMRSTRVAELEREGFHAMFPAARALDGARGALIASDTARHRRDTFDALDAGCNVLVEKPLAAHPEDAEAMVVHAGEVGRTIHVGCCLRFDEGLGFVRERIARIAPVRFVDAECLSYLPSWRPHRDYRESYSARAAEGGVLRDLVHELDYLTWMFGSPERVAACEPTSPALDLEPGVDESIACLLRFREGPLITLRLSFATHATTRRLRVVGDGGTLAWDYIARSVSHHAADGAVVEQRALGPATDMYRRQASAWLDALSGGVPSPDLATGGEGVLAVRLATALRRASRERTWL